MIMDLELTHESKIPTVQQAKKIVVDASISHIPVDVTGMVVAGMKENKHYEKVVEELRKKDNVQAIPQIIITGQRLEKSPLDIAAMVDSIMSMFENYHSKTKHTLIVRFMQGESTTTGEDFAHSARRFLDQLTTAYSNKFHTKLQIIVETDMEDFRHQSVRLVKNAFEVNKQGNMIEVAKSGNVLLLAHDINEIAQDDTSEVFTNILNIGAHCVIIRITGIKDNLDRLKQINEDFLSNIRELLTTYAKLTPERAFELGTKFIQEMDFGKNEDDIFRTFETIGKSNPYTSEILSPDFDVINFIAEIEKIEPEKRQALASAISVNLPQDQLPRLSLKFEDLLSKLNTVQDPSYQTAVLMQMAGLLNGLSEKYRLYQLEHMSKPFDLRATVAFLFQG
ncbi:hypothetical protein LDC_1229 [sediment metagenome]|uniref:Uncharacterized protein n=1 Tax=sediment metagenome TaxID=749907 RepID=D9PI73_9ZZZZ